MNGGVGYDKPEIVEEVASYLGMPKNEAHKLMEAAADSPTKRVRIAELFGMSGERVRQIIEDQAFPKLREECCF